MICGMALADAFHERAGEWVFWFGGAMVLYLLVVVAFRRELLRTLLLLLATGVLGFSLMLLAYNRHAVSLPQDIETYEAVVISEPVERRTTIRFDMTVLTGPLAGRSVRASLQKDSITALHERLRVGSGLIVSSRFTYPKNFTTSNFDYVRHLLGEGIVAQTFIPDGRWESEAVSLQSLSHLERTKIAALRLRQDILRHFRDIGLDDATYSLAAAMTFGDRTKLSDDVEDTFSITGVAHILSLSGLHLSVIYALLCFLSFSRRRRIVRELVLLLAVWTYVMIAGSHPSLVRSALMITIYTFVSISGRNPMSLNVLAFTALIMLVANPLCLFDIGFQLSFFAIGSIMLLHKPVAGVFSERTLSRHRLLRWVWHTIVLSTVAQLGTAPLVAYYFGRFPVYFLIANLVAVPLTTLILYLSVVVLSLSFIPALGGILAKVLSGFVSLLNASMELISSLPCASIEGIEMSVWQVVWAYFTIAAVCLLVRRIYKRLFPPYLLR